MLQNKPQTFNDGIVKVYDLTNTAAAGEMPKEGLSIKHTLRYKERTVGLNRYWTAQQANVKVKYVLRCPLIRWVSAQDIAIPNDGKQYRIVQVQYPEDIEPPIMDLTLEEITAKYEIS